MGMITKETFVSAHFIDNERKNLEVLMNMGHTDAMALTPHIIEADEESQDFKDLMSVTNMDAIHEETHNVKKAESAAFIEIAKQVMMDSGLAEQENMLTKTKIFPVIVENIFTNMENEDHLFALKLALFELQEIRESDNVAAKTALRKAQHKFEVLQHAFEITGVRETKVDVPAVGDPVAQAKAIEDQHSTIITENTLEPHKRPATVAAKLAETMAEKSAVAKKIAVTKKTEAPKTATKKGKK